MPHFNHDDDVSLKLDLLGPACTQRIGLYTVYESYIFVVSPEMNVVIQLSGGLMTVKAICLSCHVSLMKQKNNHFEAVSHMALVTIRRLVLASANGS